MALYPRAVLKLLAENATQSAIVPTTAIVHTAVDHTGPTSLAGFFGQGSVKVESHFFVTNLGGVEQYMDTLVRADANRFANSYAISIETEDDGDPSRPWNAAQLDALVDLLVWICETHDIPRAKCSSPKSGGVGWHSMWGAPSAWTPSRGKTCPGPVRIDQIEADLLPRLQAQEGDMQLTFTERLRAAYRETFGRPPTPGEIGDWCYWLLQPGNTADAAWGYFAWVMFDAAAKAGG